MRWLSLALIALVVLLQYPLWIGKGGWLRVWDVDRQLQQQREANTRLEVRNAGLDAEVRDLKQGYDAIEERARYELGRESGGRARRDDSTRNPCITPFPAGRGHPARPLRRPGQGQRTRCVPGMPDRASRQARSAPRRSR
ncbi:MAG: cell division protein FtsB [Proteobacteria bacterium]|nr:cell division protein FtsB [Pseudomonadota bacterium]